MRRYRCGCETVPGDEIPPGVTYATLDPKAAEKAGSYQKTSTQRATSTGKVATRACSCVATSARWCALRVAC